MALPPAGKPAVFTTYYLLIDIEQLLQAFLAQRADPHHDGYRRDP